MDVSGCSRNPVGGGSLYTSRCGVWKPAEAASCFVFRCVILVSDQTIIRNSAGTGPPPFCCPVTEAFFLNSPSNPAPPPPPRDCLLHSLHRLWFFAGGATWHINCQCIVKMTVSHERRLASCVGFFVCFFAAALLRQAGGTLRLLGSHITLPTRAVFPHKLNPIPRACLYKLWPSCLTVCGDLSGSSSHGSESHSRTWI